MKAVPPVQTDPGVFTPQQLGQYKLLHSIGEGEFAKVQACRRLRGSDEVLAAKHIVKSKLISTSNVKRTVRRVKRVGTEIDGVANYTTIACPLPASTLEAAARARQMVLPKL